MQMFEHTLNKQESQRGKLLSNKKFYRFGKYETFTHKHKHYKNNVWFYI